MKGTFYLGIFSLSFLPKVFCPPTPLCIRTYLSIVLTGQQFDLKILINEHWEQKSHRRMILNVLIIRHSTMLGYFGYFFIMFGYIGYFSPMSGYFGYFLSCLGILDIFFALFGYFGYFLTMFGYFQPKRVIHSWSPRPQSEAGRKLLYSSTCAQCWWCSMDSYQNAIRLLPFLKQGSIVTKMFAFWELTLHSMRTYFCCDKTMTHHLLQAGLCHVNTALAHFLKIEENHLQYTGLVANGQIHYRYHHHEDWLKRTPVLNPCILPASPTLEPGCFSR